MEAPKLGELVTGPAGRDAVHVAVMSVEAGERLAPRTPVLVGVQDGKAYEWDWVGSVGIVDPFLGNAVEKGQRFWLCLWPGTITSLRHVWSHPAFDAVARKRMEDMLTRELS